MIERYGGTELDCPKCGVFGKFYRMTKDDVCQHCGQLHPTVGTPMERTRLPLHKWFYAMFMFSTSRHGVAAKELERQLDIPYKTAWRMAHEIRKYMARVDGEWPLGGPGGDIEADETYIGNLGQAKGIIKLPIGQQPAVRGDLGPVKFQLQAAVEIDPKSVPFRFTHRMCHLLCPLSPLSI